MELWKLPTGDSISRYEQSIIINFRGKRKVLSTSLYNGGYHEDFNYVFNHDLKEAMKDSENMTYVGYLNYLHNLTQQLGFSPDEGTGMGTAAYMENVAIIEKSYEQLTVTAIVTAGIDGNGGRVGDPATYYRPLEKVDGEAVENTEVYKAGTINTMLYIDGDLPEPLLARALVTCTEAKTATLQELQAGICYSNGIATGTGTDQTIIIANSESPVYYDSAGKHSKLGELIGKTVNKALKLALYKQSHIGAKQQHNIFRRLKRYGVTVETMFDYYMRKYPHCGEPKFEVINRLEKWGRSSETVVLAAMWAHLVDEWTWGLLDDAELRHGLHKLGVAVAVSSESDLDEVVGLLKNHIIEQVRCEGF